MRKVGTIFGLIMTALFIIGCQADRKQEEITLYFNFPSEDIFYQRMGYAFELKYPHIKIEIIESPSGRSQNYHTDLIHMSDLQTYEELVGQGVLHPLTEYMNKDKKDMESLSPIMLDLLKLEDDGQTYGLPQWFGSSGLYYNKTLFNKYGVDQPVNGMTWSEVYKLAEQFPNTDENQNRQYGYVAGYYEHVPLNQILHIGETEGRTFINPNTLELSIDTKEWRYIGETVLTALEKGAVNSESGVDIGEMGLPPIVTGQAAMELGSFGTAFNFEMLEKRFNLEPVDWGVVTVPVDPINPEYTNVYRLNQIIGIHKGSEHKEEAWEFIKFITTNKSYYEANSAELLSFGIPVKTAFTPTINGHDLSPLYMLKGMRESNDPYDKINHEILRAFKEAAQPILDEVLQGELTLDEAFSRMQEEGQAAVDLARDRLEM